MPAPWERYQAQQQPDGPWMKYRPNPDVEPPREYEAEIRAKKAAIDKADTYDFMDELIEQGVFLGGADEIAGFAGGLGGLVKSIFDEDASFGKGYTVASEAMRDRQKEYAAKYPGRSFTARLAGGVIPGAGAAGAGLTAYRAGAPLGQAALRSGLDAAAMGTVAGLLGGEGVEGRLVEGAKGAAIGGALGGALPIAGAAGKATIGALGGNALVGALNPEGYARTLVARALQESGQNVRGMRQGMTAANRDAQGEAWTVADQLAYPGQRLLAGATQAPSNAREMAHTLLEQRQAGQGERVAASLEDVLGTGQTAQQARTAIRDMRDDTANVLYGEARDQAGPVDLAPVIQRLDQELNLTPAQATATRTRPGQAPARQRINEANLPADSIARSLARVRNSLTDVRNGVTLRDWGLIYRARQDLADTIGRVGLNPQGGYNNQGRILADIRRQVDDALEQASAPYRAAADQYRADSLVADAVEMGERAAIGTGPNARYADNIRQFQGLNPAQQDAFRAGYVSQLIGRVERASTGRNQANLFNSMKIQRELNAFAVPGRGPRYQRSQAREETMFGTRREAFGGSSTVRNLNDQQPINDTVSVIANLLRGEFGGAAQTALSRAQSYSAGYTPQVRENIIRMLMQRPGQHGQGAAFDRFSRSLTEREARNLANERNQALLLRGFYGGVAAQ